MIINPLEDNVLIEIEQPKTQTKAGILLPEKSRESTRRGKVIACGPGKRVNGERQPVSVTVGDYVLLSAYAENTSNTVTFKDKTYIVIKETEILATLFVKD